MANESRLGLPPLFFKGDILGVLPVGGAAAIPFTLLGREYLSFENDQDMVGLSQFFVMPTQYAGTNNIITRLFFLGADTTVAAVSWNVHWEVDGDDFLSDDGYFAAAQSGNQNISGTGAIVSLDIVFTNAQADAVAAGNLVRLAVHRPSADAYLNDAYLAGVEILEVVP